jgi:hypothetical protein
VRHGPHGRKYFIEDTQTMTYQIFFTTIQGQYAAMSTRLSASSVTECTTCGSGTNPPRSKPKASLNLGSLVVLPSFAQVLVLAAQTPEQALAAMGDGGVADGALCLSVEGSDPPHKVVVMHWDSLAQPPVGVNCETCPPGTIPKRWINLPATLVAAVRPPEMIFVLNFTTAAEADAWVASDDGQAALVGAVYARLTLAP